MTNFSTRGLSVGDKVIVRVSNYGTRYYVGIIEKKTPTGLVDVRYNNISDRFRADGSLYGFSMSYVCLEPSNADTLVEVERANKKDRLVGWLSGFDYNKLTLEELEEIYIKIKDSRSS